MIKTRWKKLIGDLKIYKSRFIIMILAIGITLLVISTLLTTNAVLSKATNKNYMDTNPAQATFESDFISDELVSEVEALDYVRQAEARGALFLRVKSGKGEWFPLRLFVIRDFNNLKVATFTINSGTWPLRKGEIVMERTAAELIGIPDNSMLDIRTSSEAIQLRLTGTVHDPALAPAWQERTGYGYITIETLQYLTDQDVLDDLKVVFNGDLLKEEITQYSRELASWMNRQGRPVYEIMIPPPGRHPHQNQSEMILSLFIIFAFLSLVLSSILSANIINGIMVRETKQIGIIKTIGGTSMQTAGLYLALISILCTAAVIVVLPLGMIIGRQFAVLLAGMLNFTVYSTSVPLSIYLIVVTAGLGIPLFLCLLPVIRCSLITVKEALDENGIAKRTFKSRNKKSRSFFPPFFKMIFRNTFRKKGRLILSISLLAAAGALFLASRNIDSGWNLLIKRSLESLSYDLDLRIYGSIDGSTGVSMLNSLPEIEKSEGWPVMTVSPAGIDRLKITDTYPDGGHGIFMLKGIPERTQFYTANVTKGNWFDPGIENSVIFNQRALVQYGDIGPGDTVYLNLNGSIESFILTGIVSEINPAAAYISRQYFQEITDSPGQVNSFIVKYSDNYPGTESVIIEKIRKSLAENNISIRMLRPTSLWGEALSGHAYIIIYALLVLAVVMIIVGLLGLSSAFTTAVIERKRETGVLRTIGASNPAILAILLSESLLITIISSAAAFILSLPLTGLIGSELGKMAFLIPLPFTISVRDIGLWLIISTSGSVVSAFFPAMGSLDVTIRETLVCE